MSQPGLGSVVAAVGILLGSFSSVQAQTIWASVFSLEAEPSEVQQVAQRFSPGQRQPDLVIDGGVGDFGATIGVHNQTIFASGFGGGEEVNRWDAITGAPLPSLQLNPSVASHSGDSFGFITAFDHAPNGDMLFVQSSVSFDQRSIARYSSTGDHLFNYEHPNMQHVQGSLVATDDHVFVISRFGSLEAPQERVLMFQAEGDYIGDFEIPIGSPSDLAVWENQLVVLAASDDPTRPETGGLAVFRLDGSNTVPEFSHSVTLPEGVIPETRLGDNVEYLNNSFYVSESRNGEIHQISSAGQLLHTFETQPMGDAPDMITSFVVVVPEPTGTGFLLLIVLYSTLRRCRSS